ncbi:hypothetical protein GCM10010168_65520 [Actinoplanes ianthinogenes]|uniref:Uncharacterized protein n=1 Tax=Actinoplanes ianthinogenes TaxID=122358 RepID=A0ABN6CCM4_9ACTN|nr:hypothetical protein Aiant_27280 [Actinoplanes ianthinogenes]GGR37862.1 hypothetical protein GCM10010168_65520 [Actinoplanes ianthinogenes]
MTDPRAAPPVSIPARATPGAEERTAGPHDPGPAEQYAGEPVPDPWEEEPHGVLDPGPVPGHPAE